MRTIRNLFISITLLFLTSVAYAENPAALLTLQVNNQLSEPFTFSLAKTDNQGIALANQNSNVLTVPLTADKHKGVVIVYDQNKQEVARLHIALHSFFTYIDGAIAGPDWEWKPVKVSKRQPHAVTVNIMKNSVGTCADTNIEGCSQTVEIQLAS